MALGVSFSIFHELNRIQFISSHGLDLVSLVILDHDGAGIILCIADNSELFLVVQAEGQNSQQFIPNISVDGSRTNRIGIVNSEYEGSNRSAGGQVLGNIQVIISLVGVAEGPSVVGVCMECNGCGMNIAVAIPTADGVSVYNIITGSVLCSDRNTSSCCSSIKSGASIGQSNGCNAVRSGEVTSVAHDLVGCIRETDGCLQFVDIDGQRRFLSDFITRVVYYGNNNLNVISIVLDLFNGDFAVPCRN